MMDEPAILRTTEDRDHNRGFMFRCPGCKEPHQVRIEGSHPVWRWNGDMARPTFTPSILVTSGHYVPGHEGDPCWCTYNVEHPDNRAPFQCQRCHSHVTDGKIQFLADCSHPMAGQTVPLEEWEP